ncbi:XisH family protein [Planktothrix sp. FACHB-1355]|uniref:XisH family protein n=1 Tax=Aerosakkonema funiforme FACHB-1375 TaxID=2949571 RepID=A0A926VGS2_9CYAN|nr:MULTISPECIES: XisH family protein [Oscillatoriales]MBD2183601.1 XisH family protein [Aerosakkonema funiforme FACHB-1375]MBD3559492.1 XisH family protein [Planktothrix sp. FACHB-1355]
MPAKDIYHDAVKNALIKDGWTITADPYTIEYEDAELYADLAAEKPIAAELNGRKIIVEIKSFISPSLMRDFENALGQYILYRNLLKLNNQRYEIYLAVRDSIFDTFFQRKSIQAVVKLNEIALIVFSNEREEIVEWIN